MQKHKLSSVQIRNIKGIEELEIKPGALTILAGKNGLGKTSGLDAVKGALKGGHDATLLNDGADEGSITLNFDDGLQIRKFITREGSEIKLRTALGPVTKKPMEVLKGLFDAVSVDPAAIMRAEPKQRAAMLLEVMPLTVERSELAKVLEVPETAAPEIGDDVFQSLETVRKVEFDKRTQVNVVAKQKRATIAQLQEGLPEGGEDTDMSAVAREKAAEQARLVQEQTDKLGAARTALLESENAVDAAHEQRVAALQKAFDAKMAALRTEQDAAKAALYATHEAEAEAIRVEYAPKIAEAAQAAGAATERATQAAAHQRQREIIKNMVDEAVKLEDESAKLTRVLHNIEALKGRLLDTCPIPGVTAQNGDVYIDGRPFDNANTARKVEVCMEIAALRVGEVGIMTIDHLESLDSEHREAFAARAAQMEMNIFGGMVTDDSELVITTL